MSMERRFSLIQHKHLISDLKQSGAADGETIVWDDASNMWIPGAGGGGGVTDHGALTGLGDDDHPQYPLVASTETISGAWTFSDLTVFTKLGADSVGSIQLNSNQPTLEFEEADIPSTWQISSIGGELRFRAIKTDNSATDSAMRMVQADGVVTGVDFDIGNTELTRNSNVVWDQGNVGARIAALTNETSIDSTADTLVVRDDSAADAREVLVSDILKLAAPGSLQFVASTTLGSSNANITVSGLDLDAHVTYIVVTRLKNSAATTATLSMFYNSDTTTTNYNTSIASNGASTQANNASIGSLFNSTDSTVAHYFTISRPGTRVVAGSNVALTSNSSSNIRAGTVTHEWKTASTNVTGITINCGASTFDTGSCVFVYRLLQGGTTGDIRPYGVFANADQTKTSDTALADDTVLKATLLAAKKYKVTFTFAVDSTPTPDYKYDINYTGTMASQLVLRRYSVHTTASLATGDPGTSGSPHLASALNVVTTFTVGATDTLYIELTITCETTTGGVLSLRWAQGTSSGNATVRRKNACVEVKEFA